MLRRGLSVTSSLRRSRALVGQGLQPVVRQEHRDGPAQRLGGGRDLETLWLKHDTRAVSGPKHCGLAEWMLPVLRWRRARPQKEHSTCKDGF